MTRSTFSQVDPPGPGHWTQISEGLLWARMRIPAKLDHINIYLIEDDDGWFVVDTGPDTSVNRDLWRELVTGLPRRAKLSRVLVTHSHPDHIGLAGWLQAEFGVPIYISSGAHHWALREAEERKGRSAQAVAAFYGRMGVPSEDVVHLHAALSQMDPLFGPLASEVSLVQADGMMRICGRNWEPWVGSGHSIEHVCLYQRESRLLIAGDQLLEKITPLVGVSYMSPECNPLADWFASLTDMQCRLPNDALVLPAHGQPFYGGARRIGAVLEHHESSLAKLRGSLVDWCTVHELSHVLGWGGLTGMARYMALDETLAHITYLVCRGEVVGSPSAIDDAYRYRLARRPSAPS
ncbi:MBL fold metallo-hydrolase [Pseudomonas aeruginosa]|nr:MULTISPECIES: MBL fold metallo-hydrolase [Pseudomonas]MBG6788830.1 MBL fold metallo-hydrolase [Pseudomonas aeruginosa]MBH3799122.1 MBL fold metallo-hydrolase [Pseudomonas aeruginosa]MBH9217142.1 MBL fold metallo-hydrolase [Pseudomonas aeruginosa]MBL7581212.1 MBL fold metallo-hydrolase [Pseudomonas aeruginosa]MBT1078307.1 MBL fold metallo-hydrolase [Pseudomonas aeruginosa]